MSDPEDKELVPVSGVKLALARRVWVTAVLLGLAVLLGAFLLATRQGMEAPSWFVGEWHSRVSHPIGGEFDERLVLREAGAEVSGSATYRGVRRIIEEVVVADDQLSFVTRRHDRSGNAVQTVMLKYVVKPTADGRVSVELSTTDAHHGQTHLSFIASQP